MNEINVPENTLIQSDGLPRLTYGGFVGSAIVNPDYAVRVKGTDVYVDIRDFFVPADTPRNRRRHTSARITRTHRRAVYGERMMHRANIPITTEIYLVLPNGIGVRIKAAIVRIGKHIKVTTTNAFNKIVDRVKKNAKIRIAYAVENVEGKVIGYTTKLTDAVSCELTKTVEGVERRIDTWLDGMNCVEQNNLALKVPSSELIRLAPTTIGGVNLKQALTTYTANGNGLSLTVPIDNGWFKKFLTKGITAIKRTVTIAAQLVPVVKQGIAIIKALQVTAENANARSRCSVYILSNIDDLMEALQRRYGRGDWPHFFSQCISPAAHVEIDPEASLLVNGAVSRNGFSLSDLDVHYCHNFAEVCRIDGFASIDAMLDDVKSNGVRARYLMRPFISSGLRNLIGNHSDLITPIIEPGDVDYTAVNAVYPMSGDDLIVSSMDGAGIGGKNSLTNTFPYNELGLEDETSDPDREQIACATEYSIGNSIPAKLVYELDPDFVAGGGTEENVGVYHHYSEFDFGRICLFLEDANGFRVPCSTLPVSVLNFDSTVVGSRIATLRINGQGTTQLSVPFPYTIVANKIVTLLSETTTQKVQMGTRVDPAWIVNAVSDAPLTPDPSNDEYVNVSSLTPAGFTFEPAKITAPDPGTITATVTIRLNSDLLAAYTDPIESEVQFEPVQLFAPEHGVSVAESSEKIRDRYAFVGWLDDAVIEGTTRSICEGVPLYPENIMFSLQDRVSNEYVWYGSAKDAIGSGFVQGANAIHLNSQVIGTGTSLDPKLKRGLNNISINACLSDGVDRIPTTVWWSFTTKVEDAIIGAAFGLSNTGRAKMKYAVHESMVLNPSQGGYKPGDFSLGITRARRGSVALIAGDVSNHLDGFEIVGFEYKTRNSKVGLCRIRPIIPDGLIPQSVMSTMNDVLIPVHRESLSTIISLEGVDLNYLVKVDQLGKPYYIDFSSQFVSEQESDPHYPDCPKGSLPCYYKWYQDDEEEIREHIYLPAVNFTYCTQDPEDELPTEELHWAAQLDTTPGVSPYICACLPTYNSSGQFDENVLYGFRPIIDRDVKEQTLEFVDASAVDEQGVIHVPYGTILTADHFNLKIDLENSLDHTIANTLTYTHTHLVLIAGYDPYDRTGAVQQARVMVWPIDIPSGGSVPRLEFTVDIKVDKLVITDLIVRPKRSKFQRYQTLTESDYEVTAKSSTGEVVPVAPNEYVAVDYDSLGSANQTGMLTVMSPPEGASPTGLIATASSRYDIGAGGGNAVFNLPALVCEWSHPWCMVGDIITSPYDLGLENAYLISNTGDRTEINLDDIVIEPVDTSVAGTVEVKVSLRESNWRATVPVKIIRF